MSMDIYEFLIDANRLNVNSEKEKRFQLQTRAITSCDKLSCLVEMSMNLRIIDSGRSEYWQGLINDVKYMTFSWRKNDIAR